MSVWGVVLAAGDSSRMGRPKALLDLDGRSFLQAVLETQSAAGLTDRVVVLGRHAHLVRAVVSLDDVTVAVNPDPSRGMLSSLKGALAALEGRRVDAVMLSLGDQPTVSADTLRALLEARRRGDPDAVYLSRRAGKRGHPVLLGSRALAAARALPDSAELRQAVKAHPTDLRDVDVPDPAIHQDVDTPSDYERLCGHTLDAV